MNHFNTIILGGGAAGFFTAIQIAARHPELSIAILEKNNKCLEKVRISGGGRCNVTNSCYDPELLSQHYPRGQSFLKPLFKDFGSKEMVQWLKKAGVETKIEPDGRIFPRSNDSQTIIDCFQKQVKAYGIKVKESEGVQAIEKVEKTWKIQTKTNSYTCDKLAITTGSSPQMWQVIKSLGHTLVSPTPSLFTFQIKHPLLVDLLGISFPHVEVKVSKINLSSQGPLLITHWGLSGPAILRLSAWGSKELAKCNYQFELIVNWLGQTKEVVLQQLQAHQLENSKQKSHATPLFGLPKRFWLQLLATIQFPDRKWAEIGKKDILKLAEALTTTKLPVTGKSTFKDEFVTAGGVALSEINPKTMESNLIPNLYFAGEVLDIDAITGGFNFQAAWTTGWHLAKSF